MKNQTRVIPFRQKKNVNFPLFNKASSAVAALLVAALATACVTVNVNFPESAVQKATDDYVRELYRAKEKGKEKPTVQVSPTHSGIGSLYGLLIPTASAAEANITVNTEKALAIRDHLASRLEEVLSQKRAGVLGESNDGMITLQAPEKLKPLLKKKVESLVAAENSDRNELYDEVLRANGLAKNRVKDIQKSFARSFQAESPSGTWVQDSEGKWAQKP